ncbi:MAG: S41 family peptidase [Candidatus Competibacteraceae bacterium]|nr:S41 family peptidase [Candidatus Competibacteraceae bacterium]MBK7983933.1 S41 family peptidase [Candidatus Competibacteraceae bacterium]MBK8897525.1 S41 family peptidase [Candidatus Competibacteraceae bacterium]MBK8963677.1 S41 family peptidase [Candidatus Competibacteraceae bacterium]MBK9950567.1 S41 family peptidase [Candidatus Competibacteraceae bacterium]
MSAATRHGLALALSFLAGVSLTALPTVRAEKDTPLENKLPLDELRTFTGVLDAVKQDYVESIKDKDLLENAIRGMLSNLDPHSAFLDAEAFQDLQVGTSGEFGGLGIEVGQEDGFIKVITPIDDTPAARAGVRSGDLIIRLDDTSVKGMALSDAIQRMRGKPNTAITLTIIREGLRKPLKMKLVREVIQVKSVKSRLLEPGFAYLRVTQFQAKTAQNLQHDLQTLEQQNKAPLKGLVLDLRNNPGGVLNGAVDVADDFLDDGVIVETKGRGNGSDQSYKATPGDLLKSAPMVVLVNGGSASASEIVAGALQDHHRALILGERTFGKGSVQTILPLGNGTAVKLTTARYYTPKGRSIQAAGIEPDIKLKPLKIGSADSADPDFIKEADLTGHLRNDRSDKPESEPPDVPPDPKTLSDPAKTPNAEGDLAQNDYQLYEALNLLKGMTLLHNRKSG